MKGRSRDERKMRVPLNLKTINPEQFFHNQIQRAIKKNDFLVPENVEFYLLKLLCEKIKAFSVDDDETCLALILKRALESPLEEKIVLYKKMGDHALYLSGFFKDFCEKGKISLSYYIQMGENAYKNLSYLTETKKTWNQALPKMYFDMSQHFKASMTILHEIASFQNAPLPYEPSQTLSWQEDYARFETLEENEKLSENIHKNNKNIN
jgi:hypothetical protein